MNKSYNKEEIDQTYVIIGVNGIKLSTGSLLAYDEKGYEYFAIYSLVKLLNRDFQQLIKGKQMFILALKEIWTGPKWNNKVVQKIIFLSDCLESINLKI